MLINLWGHCLQNIAQLVTVAYTFFHILVSANISCFVKCISCPLFQSSVTLYTNCNFSNVLVSLLSFAYNVPIPGIFNLTLFPPWFLPMCFNLHWPAMTRWEFSNMTVPGPLSFVWCTNHPISCLIKCLVFFFTLLWALWERFFLIHSCIPSAFYT